MASKGSGAPPASIDVDRARALETALAAARAAARVHRAHRGRTPVTEWTTKATSDFVTHVDRDAEAEALAAIRDAFPDHAVMAEEGAPDAVRSRSGALWIVDPLDGTTNYLHGYPEYCASVALAVDGELVAGAVVASNGDEYVAARGAGARCNGESLAVSGIDRLELALIGTGFPFKALDRLPDYQRQFARVLQSTSGVRRAGSAALDLCHVASGWFDGFWELSLAPWDIAAGALIVAEAGGVVTRLDSGHLLDGGGYLAGNPSIHEQLGRLIRDA